MKCVACDKEEGKRKKREEFPDDEEEDRDLVELMTDDVLSALNEERRDKWFI